MDGTCSKNKEALSGVIVDCRYSLYGIDGPDSSDVDSGIVSGLDQRTLSSNDETDSSCASPVAKGNKSKVQPHADFRFENVLPKPRGEKLLPATCCLSANSFNNTEHRCQPLLRECNRRPPTPLSVFSSKVRGVEDFPPAHLSEQTLRRSCRKLFATLYAQRFTHPPPPPPLPGNVQKSDGGQGDAHLRPTAMCIQSRMEQRARSRTLSDLELRRYAAAMIDSRNHPYWTNRPAAPTPWRTREKTESRCKKAVTWNLKNNRCGCRPPPTASSDDDSSDAKAEGFTADGRISDSSIASEGTQKKILGPRYERQTNGTRHSTGPYRFCERNFHSSQQANLLPSGSQRQCSCYCATCESGNIFSKSSSCSLLPTVDELEPQPEECSQFTDPPVKPHEQLKKMSSSSNIVRALDYRDFQGIATCRDDSMVHVYAHVASVVPESIATNDEVTSNETKNDAKSDEQLRVVPCTRCYQSRTLLPLRENGAPRRSDSRFPMDQKNRLNTTPQPGIELPLIRGTPHAAIATIRPTTTDSKKIDVNQHDVVDGEVEYAVVDTSKKTKSFATSLPTLNHCDVVKVSDENEPPVPPKKNLHTSDFTLYRGKQDGSRKGFFERFQELTRNAKNAFQKAFSTERIYRPEKEERLEASSRLHRTKSFVKGLRASISRKRKKKNKTIAEVVAHPSGTNAVWGEGDDDCDGSSVRGQLLQLNLDGSQVVELSKAPSKPYGFFVARGRVHNSKGIFVSRMRDQETQKQLAGLLDIGDEILEVEGLDVKNADIMEVNDLISKKNTLLLTVLPYICRKDI